MCFPVREPREDGVHGHVHDGMLPRAVPARRRGPAGWTRPKACLLQVAEGVTVVRKRKKGMKREARLIWAEVVCRTSITFSNSSLNRSGCATGVAVVQSFTPRCEIVCKWRRSTWCLDVGSGCVCIGCAGVDDQQFRLLGRRAQLTWCSSYPVTSRHRNFK